MRTSSLGCAVSLLVSSSLACAAPPEVERAGRSEPAAKPTANADRREQPASPPPRGPAAPECPPCDGATRVGTGWAYTEHRSVATKLGRDDANTTIDVLRVEGECCRPQRTDQFEPGWRVIASDPTRAVLRLRGHDARWAAYAADGIVELALATGERRVLVSHILQEIACETADTSVLALVTRTDGASADEFEAGAFHLELLDLRPPGGAAPVRHRVATSAYFARLYPDHDEEADELLRRGFGFSADCLRLTWSRGSAPAKSPLVFSLAAARARPTPDPRAGPTVDPE